MPTSVVNSTSDFSWAKAFWINVGKSNPVKMLSLRWFLETGGPVTFKYWYPPSWTIPSSCSVFKPASTAKARVTVKMELGSRFILSSSMGDCVVEFALDMKLVVESIVPKLIPNTETVDLIRLILRSAAKGLARATETSEILLRVSRAGSKTSRKISSVKLISAALGTCYVIWRKVRNSHQSLDRTCTFAPPMSWRRSQCLWCFERNSDIGWVLSLREVSEVETNEPSLSHSPGLTNLFSNGYICVSVSKVLDTNFPLEE